MSSVPTFSIRFRDRDQPLALGWNEETWRDCDTLEIAAFHPRSSAHRPVTHARLFATPEALHVQFRVQDRFVKSVATKYQDMVCRDSCVELFWQPVPGGSYFNFEFNCGGVMLLYCVRAVRNGKIDYEEVREEHAREIEILTTLPQLNPVELTEPTDWQLAAKIPYRALTPYIGEFAVHPGMESRGNLFKCASLNSHPHWAAWVPIGEALNFHQPDKFGRFKFASGANQGNRL